MTSLVSGEGVPLELERAGLGSRSVAAVLDLVVQFALLLSLFALNAVLISGSDDAAVAALIIVEVVLVLAGYPILFEWLTRGRTLGKMAMGLRVLRDDGGPIGLRQAVVRGLAAFLLEKPGLIAPLGTAAGVFTIIFSPASKRIGDVMAGTFVVNERAGPRSALIAPAFAVPWALQRWASELDLTRVDDQLALAVRQFVLRAAAFTPQAQYDLGEQLRHRVTSVIAPPPPQGLPAPILLTTILAERRRRAEQAHYASFPPQYGQPAQYGQAQYGQAQYGQPTQYGQLNQNGQTTQYSPPAQYGQQPQHRPPPQYQTTPDWPQPGQAAAAVAPYQEPNGRLAAPEPPPWSDTPPGPSGGGFVLPS